MTRRTAGSLPPGQCAPVFRSEKFPVGRFDPDSVDSDIVSNSMNKRAPTGFYGRFSPSGSWRSPVATMSIFFEPHLVHTSRFFQSRTIVSLP